MRTINTLLEYNLSEHEKTCLYQCGIINGIGGEGQNIENILRSNIELLPWFDNSKAEALISDMKKLSEEHDIQYKFKMWFYLSNYKFSKKLFHLLHWWWAKRFAIFLIALILLNRYWKPFYNK